MPKVIQTKSVELTSSKNERKPWLPRVALLPPRRLALQQKIQEKEVHTRIKLNTKPKLPLEKPKLPSEKPKLQLEKPKALSELMESKESRDTYLKYNQIMRLSQIGLQSNLPVENVSVQTSEKDRIITPTPRPKRPFFNNNPQHRDADRAILISSPVQLDKTSQVLRDKTSFYNIPPSKLIRNSTQSNVAVINIIKDDFVSRQLSVQVLPSVSIECDIPRRRKRQKNFQLIVEKGSNSSSIDENFNGETKPKEKATNKEKETVETSHTSTQTKNVSTSFDQNYETSIQKLPLDTITVRQLLRDLITALKEDENAQKKEETQESVKEPVQDETKPTTKCQGVSTDSFEQKSQFVSMEIETRSQGSATNENYSKSQQVQVQIERKEFKDATTMAEETKEFKDAGVLAKDFDNESKEIGIQTLELIRQSDNVESNENFKSTEDKSTGMDSPSRSDSREGSSDSAQSLQQKDTITNREIGIQVRVSSSSSSLSTFNESSSAIVSSSTTTTTSSSALSDELISEGEVIFKHPFPHVPRKFI